jgi:hypothetical protein
VASSKQRVGFQPFFYGNNHFRQLINILQARSDPFLISRSKIHAQQRLGFHFSQRTLGMRQKLQDSFAVCRARPSAMFDRAAPAALRI